MNSEDKRQLDRNYRKKLGEIYRERQRCHYKKYYKKNVKKERDKNLTFQELRKIKRGDKMKTVGNAIFVQQVVSPNGTRMNVVKSSGVFYLKIREFVKAVGYSAFTADGTIGMAFDAKSSESKICCGFINSGQTYLVNFSDVLGVLNRLIKILNAMTSQTEKDELKKQEVQLEAVVYHCYFFVQSVY